jgi:hypothetical protein
MCESTRAFIITQFGLSCFERLPPGGAAAAGAAAAGGGGGAGAGGGGGGPGAYAARTFNFWVFPQPAPPAVAGLVPEGVASRRFTCDASSLAFLCEQARAARRAWCRGS